MLSYKREVLSPVRLQRPSDGSGCERQPVPETDDRLGAKHRRLLL